MCDVFLRLLPYQTYVDIQLINNLDNDILWSQYYSPTLHTIHTQFTLGWKNGKAWIRISICSYFYKLFFISNIHKWIQLSTGMSLTGQTASLQHWSHFLFCCSGGWNTRLEMCKVANPESQKKVVVCVFFYRYLLRLTLSKD